MPDPLDLLRRYGWNTTSFQILEPGYAYWFGDDGDSVVAYVDTGRYWMAAGAPICPAERLADVALQFAEAARRVDREGGFFGAGARLVHALQVREELYDWLQVGIEACFDPRRWSENVPPSSQVASQTRRALRKGVTVREADAAEFAEEAPLRHAASRLTREWLHGQPMAPLSFLAHLDLFSNAPERRYFVAETSRTLVGLLAVVPIFARGGWFLEDLLTDPQGPPGTGEGLVHTAMQTLEREQAHYASMGMVALAGLTDRPQEARHPVLTSLLRWCYDSLNWLYGFRGLQAFRSKFKPSTWEPVYLVAARRVTLWTVLAVLQAFAGGRLDRFATATGRKLVSRLTTRISRPAWAGACYVLAALLVPWIAILLLSDSSYWFGTPWLGQAWASFDIAVAVCFALLGRAISRASHGGRPLARVLLGVVLADSWMTAAQALLYNFQQPGPWLDRAVTCIAMAAPVSASLFLLALLLSDAV